MARVIDAGRVFFVLPFFVWLLALTLTGMIAAHWYWRFAAPSAVYAGYEALTDPVAVGGEISRHHPWGLPVLATSESVQMPQAFRLVGVVTRFGSFPGFAILRVNGEEESISAVIGEEFFPGVTLTEMTPHSVRIRQGGIESTLNLEGPAVADLSVRPSQE